MNEKIEKIFGTLRPLCVEIAKNPFDHNSLDRLLSEIKNNRSTDPEIWRCLFDYVAFPLRLLIRRANSQNTDDSVKENKEKIENCLFTIFDILRILVDRCGGEFNRSEIIISLLSDSFLLINYPPGTETTTECNRLIIAVADFASVLLNFGRIGDQSNGIIVNRSVASADHQSNSNIRKILLANQPVLAQVVFALLRCLKKTGGIGKSIRLDDDEERNVQISIIRCLSIVLALDDRLSAAFLPGVASGLADFILGLCTKTISNRDEFIVECFEIWTRTVMAANSASSDQISAIGIDRDRYDQSIYGSIESSPASSAFKTEEWRRNAGLQLTNIFERLSSTLIAHRSILARRSLCNTAILFLECKNNDSILFDCKKRALEIVAALIADDQLDIDEKSIIDIRKQYGDLLEKLLLSTLWRLPRSSESPLSSQQRIDWQCLIGYLRLLGPDGVSNFLVIADHKETFFYALMNSLKLAEITEEIKPTGSISEEELPVKSLDKANCRRRLARPSDPVAQDLVIAVCKFLARVHDLNLVYDFLYHRLSIDRLPAIFILNALLSMERASGDRSPAPDLLSAFVDVFLGHLRNPDSLMSIEACLNLEGLGHCAVCLRDRFRPCLIDAFYVVLALLRRPDYKDYAWNTLFDFASALDYGSVIEMVIANSDYLSSSLTLRLRRFGLYLDSAAVLASILDISPWSSIGAFRGTITETLAAVDRLASYPEHRQSIAALLKVSERFCVLVADKAPILEKSISDIDQAESAPWHIRLVVNVLQRIRSWLLADGVQTRLASLRVLEAGLRALARKEDALLPLVHQTWPSTLARLGDVLENTHDETLIVVSTAAFLVMVTMTEVSGNFVCRRVQEEAWPKIRQVLKKYLPISKSANAIIYGQSPSFRLQLSILEKLGEICKNVKASSAFLKEVVDFCRIYDSEEVLPALKKAAAGSLQEIEIESET